MQQSEQFLHPSQYNEQLRFKNDIETLFGECLRGPMRTPLELYYDHLDPEADLRSEAGEPLGQIFDESITDIEQKAANDARYSFDVLRRREERLEYYDMIDMMEDEDCNTIVVRSDFPDAVKRLGYSFAGYDIERQQAYVRVLVRRKDAQGRHKLFMYSQSLDGSNRDGLEAIGNYLGHASLPGELLGQRIKLTLDEAEQHTLIDMLTNIYDTTMQQKTGIKHYAGMPIKSTVLIDTLAFAKQQSDIVNYAVQLRGQGVLTTDKQYDLIALLHERYDLACQQEQPVFINGLNQLGHVMLQNELLEQQSHDAGVRAQAQGKTWNACGMTMNINQETNVADRLEGAGYSAGREEDKFGPRRFKCAQGHWNKRPLNKMIPKCRVLSCKEGSVGCGKEPNKKKSKSSKKGKK